MILVTVGTARDSFRRLLEAMDELAAGELRDHEIVMQVGHDEFRPRHCAYETLMPRDRFTELLERADVVVAHGGGGTLLQVFRTGRVPVAMPRLGSRGECLDDHQVDLVRALAEEGRVVPAYEPEDLPGAIRAALQRNRQAAPPPASRMVGLVADAIRELIGPPDGR